jgi:hypothetical protein
VVTAVKPSGNPIARGSAAAAAPHDGITVRLYEPHGRPAAIRLHASVAVREAFAADLLERPTHPLPVGADGSVEIALDGYAVATVIVVPRTPTPAAPGGAGISRPEATGAEADREPGPLAPVYARYWLHNVGPAPINGLPITVHAAPTAVTGTGPVDLRVTVASDLTDAEWTGLLRVATGTGWAATPAEWPVALGPGEFAELSVRVTVADDALAGDHLIGVSVEHAGQVVEDLVTITVPGPAGAAVSSGEVSVALDTPAVSVRPGGRATLRAVLENRFRSPVHAVAHLVGPVDTWELTPQPVSGQRLDADGTARLEFPVVAAPDTRPGSWWLLVKLMYAGRVAYTDSVRLTVDPLRR